MPPDITSIDSDINKIGALTPSPFLDGNIDVFNMTSNAAIGGGGGNSNPRSKQFYNQAVSSGFGR